MELLAQLDVLQAKRRLAALADGRCLPLPVAEGIQLLDARATPCCCSTRVAECAKDKGKDAKDNSLASPAALAQSRALDIVLRPGERALVITGGNAVATAR